MTKKTVISKESIGMIPVTVPLVVLFLKILLLLPNMVSI